MDEKRKQQILRKTAVSMTGIILSALSWILSIVGFLNPVVSIAGVLVGLLISGITIFKSIYEYEEKIDGFENARPEIVPKPRNGIFPANTLGATATTHTTHSSQVVERIELKDSRANFVFSSENGSECWFALVDFYNKPIEPIDRSVAREVSAHITYYDKECKPRINKDGISGRWWSNEEVAISNKPRRELERTDIFPGEQGVTLVLACMGIKESAIYGFNNDNHEYKDYKKSEFSLGMGSYYIKVVLAGINLKETEFWFSIWRDISSGELKIERIKKPDCVR